MLPNKKYENIERFLNKEMSPSEQVEFQQELDKDKGLAKGLALYQDLPKHLEGAQGSLAFNEELKIAERKYKEQKATKTGSKRNFFVIAAIILALLLSIFAWQQFSNNNKSTEIPADIPIASLWEGTAQPSANIQRSGVKEEDIAKYQNAYKLYDLGNYTEALTTLGSIASESDIYSETLLLKGVIEYQNQEYGSSIHSFDTYLTLENIEDLALWYQSLAYVQNKQNEAARKNLQKIIDNDYDKANEAKILIKQL